MWWFEPNPEQLWAIPEHLPTSSFEFVEVISTNADQASLFRLGVIRMQGGIEMKFAGGVFFKAMTRNCMVSTFGGR